MPANIYNTKNFQKRCFHANSSCPQWAAQRSELRSVPLWFAQKKTRKNKRERGNLSSLHHAQQQAPQLSTG